MTSMFQEPESDFLMQVTWSSPVRQESRTVRGHLCNNIAHLLYLKKQKLNYSKVLKSS